MEKHRSPFQLDRENGKILGVCAGIATHFGIDVTLVRIGMAVSAFATFPLVVFGYFLVAMIVGQKARPKQVRKSGRAAEARETMRELDVRLQALERDVTSSGTRLAREIDSLR